MRLTAQEVYNRLVDDDKILELQGQIKFYFGDKYGLLFDSQKDMGTLVTILLPILSEDSTIKEF